MESAESGRPVSFPPAFPPALPQSVRRVPPDRGFLPFSRSFRFFRDSEVPSSGATVVRDARGEGQANIGELVSARESSPDDGGSSGERKVVTRSPMPGERCRTLENPASTAEANR